MSIISRIRRFWALSNKDPKAIDLMTSLNKEDLKIIPDINEGDGNAVFFEEGTEDDYLEFQKEQSGVKAWIERIRNL